MNMHTIQQSILSLLDSRIVLAGNLRQLGAAIGVDHPQKVKHHLTQLEKKNLISIDPDNKSIRRIETTTSEGLSLTRLPILGSANCGEALIYADEDSVGCLQVSSRMVRPGSGLFVLRAVGNSMNAANIQGKSINDGDYIVIDKEKNSPRNGEYVLSLIDGAANIKRFALDKENNYVVLQSESTTPRPPIIIHPDDPYAIGGTVVDVIKCPTI